MRTLLRPAGRDDRGAAAVEFALLLPVLILVIGGIVDFGRAYFENVILTNAAREGARAAVVIRNSPPLSCGSVTGCIEARAKAAASGLDPATLAVSVPENGCTAAVIGATARATVTVSHTMEWTFLTPLLGPSEVLTRSATMGCV